MSVPISSVNVHHPIQTNTGAESGTEIAADGSHVGERING